MTLAYAEVYSWVNAVLTADATLTTLLGGANRVFQREPYTGAPYPRITQAHLVETPVKMVGATTLYGQLDWQTMISSATRDAATLAAIGNRVLALLDRQSGTTAGGTVFGCYFDRAFESTDPPAQGQATPVLNLIQRWRIEAKGA